MPVRAEERAANVTTAGRPDVQELGSTIERIETIPIRVPLDKTYSGSYYRMSHRSTIITRVITSDGVAGVAYAADEDESLPVIDRIIHDEIAPRVVGQSLLAVERIWEFAYPATFDQL